LRHLESGAPVVVKPMLFQQFCRDLHLATACKHQIVRVQFFGVIVFLVRSNEISAFSMFPMDQGAHFVRADALGSIFGRSVFCFGAMKYQQFLFFDGSVSYIGRPFNHHT